MEPVATKKTKVIFRLFILFALISIGLTYYKYMIKKDFEVVTQEE